MALDPQGGGFERILRQLIEQSQQNSDSLLAANQGHAPPREKGFFEGVSEGVLPGLVLGSQGKKDEDKDKKPKEKKKPEPPKLEGLDKGLGSIEDKVRQFSSGGGFFDRIRNLFN